MNNHRKTDHITRENILRLLSDHEVASVSHLEATARLLDGEEYLDLEQLGQGVRNDFGTTNTPMGHVLPRRAVHPATWDKILEQVALLRAAGAQSSG
jgi:hypothetical protein